MALNSVCVHGHFYQPPREDPLSGLIPEEPGAEPYSNWNERIHQECYKPNADLGNFEKISFNIGPTLISWMEKYDPTTYRSIIAQENKNFYKYGVGNGLSQSYNHTILPLANKRDKITQVKWGIADFVYRFGHKPMGMWLPETAVDLETLSVLADHGIKFTLLAPWQVEADQNIYTDQPYWVKLPGNRNPMIIFFYDQNLSTMVSFQAEATRNADYFIERWLSPEFSRLLSSGERLTLIASDGELYGHHKALREHFLSYMLNGALTSRGIKITYPGLWLQDHQPTNYVRISEYTSWSCHHGIIRWMGECDCSPGASWKSSLRWGLEVLANAIDHEYQTNISRYTPKIWDLRDDYIHVYLGDLSHAALLEKYIQQKLTGKEFQKINLLLAAQYERQRIFTSCGWFFNSFHRIEPQNNIAYAAQAVWLTKEATGTDLRPRALALLKKVRDPNTGLRGDTVFSERYLRMQHFSADHNDYFNDSNSFST